MHFGDNNAVKYLYINAKLMIKSTVTFSSQRSPLENMLILHPGLVNPRDGQVHIHWGVLSQDVFLGWDTILDEEETEQKKE